MIVCNESGHSSKDTNFELKINQIFLNVVIVFTGSCSICFLNGKYMTKLSAYFDFMWLLDMTAYEYYDLIEYA